MLDADETLRSRVLRLVRRGSGEVNWVPPALGLGNHLYMWLHAWTRQQSGVNSRILFHESMRTWLHEFPSLRPLTVERGRVGLTDRRVIVWGQSFGTEFTEEELQQFIESCLLESQTMKEALSDARLSLPAGRLVVNVRRGDYYSVPEFLRSHGMNVKSYVGVAVLKAAAQSEINGVRVVSDDPHWCRENLTGLRQYGPVDFGPESRTPLGDLATLAAAETLVLANSTFSYWGAYINGVLSSRDQNTIWAPAFHARNFNHGQAWHLDPKWNVIDDLPGGWVPPETSLPSSLSG
jgi:hypothetical protein